ncbi:hypothetical protein Vadar_016517 [Vaccinium darrowii]|uniref:Uncharacterized protein n=1 Tax=Vaccinium darrowii TaxID=229202 RepID=A0ACB7XRA8_9ERIC|nr:hypothetical protein Vadar_016517 [Vaccinium darrowii]
MSLKRKHDFGSHLQPPPNPNLRIESWEEQAFAEDASGHLGGCVWPPRSYSCSFCRREFLSAQALGGHMNVHRRDRARLKQSPNPSHSDVLHHHILTPCTSLDPNPIYSASDRVVFAPPSLASRVFSPTHLLQENRDEGVFLPIFSSLNIENHGNERSPSSRSNVDANKCIDHTANLNNEEMSKEDCIKADVSANLFIARRFHQTCDEEEVAMSCKRRRATDSNSSGGNTYLQSEVLELMSTNSTEEEEEAVVDLELRLGGRPKVE